MNNCILRFFIAISLLSIACNAKGGNPSIPIIAYGGVPQNFTTDEHYRILRECGFDYSIVRFNSIQAFCKALDCADRNKIKLIAHCPQTHDEPENSARILKNYPALFGYFIEDEPGGDRITILAKEIEKIKSQDCNHLCYMNLLPWYDKGQFHTFKTDSYTSYIQRLIDAGSQIISFDIYPIQEEGIRPSWYENLEFIRKASIKSKVPFWAFALCTPHFNYPQPTLEQLRLQVYSNLLYGAQGIEYFTYWTPPVHGKFDYHDGPIDAKGQKTPTYSLVQSMNKELHTIGQLFYGARIQSVYHMVKIPEGTKKLSTPPINIKRIIVSGKEGAIVSQFKKDNHIYMAIQNKSYTKRITVQILAKNNIPVRITKDLQAESLRDKYTLPGGDIVIVRLK